jgi:hypothetical protein
LSRIPLLAIAAVYFVSSTTSAYAYLDPGTGSIILQGIIASIAAGVTAVSFYFNRIKNYLLSIFRSSGSK